MAGMRVEAASVEILYEAARKARDLCDAPSLERLSQIMLAHGNAGNAKLLADGEMFYAFGLLLRGDSAHAHVALDAAAAVFDTLADRDGQGAVASIRATLAFHLDGDREATRRYCERCLSLAEASSDPHYAGMAFANLGEIAVLEGDYHAALRHESDAIAIFHELGDRGRVGWQLSSMAHVHLLRRDMPAFRAAMEEAFAELDGERTPRFLARYFDVCFLGAARLQRWAEAATIAGFIGRLRDDANETRLQGLLPWISGSTERLSQNVPEPRLTELLREGENLSVEDAQELAMRTFAA
jgi:tetratricopeptide (TPR) repeat protein